MSLDPFDELADGALKESLRLRRRTRLMIYLDILCAVERVKQRFGLARMTRVQYEVNVPYDRFRGYIEGLIKLGLVNNEDQLNLTQRGHAYVLEYRRFIGFLESNGIPTDAQSASVL